MKILAIGNSFSVNAFAYLERMAAAGKEDFQLGNLYIGGCSLAMHNKNFKENNPNYEYHIKANGGSVVLKNYTIKKALVSDEWDVVTLQQASHDSGIKESYEPHLKELIEVIKELQPQAKIMLHETWAYENTSEHGCFNRYDRDQEKMYNALKDAYYHYADKYSLEIIPVGDAFQIARGMDIFDVHHGGKTLCASDGFHASATHGQYLAAAVWYEKLTGNSILENPYSVDGISFYELMTLKKSAHLAVNGK